MRLTHVPLLLIALSACRDPVLEDTGPDPLLVDADGDGIPAVVDCNEEDASVYPGADETCDGVDQDCDGEVDDNAIDGVYWFEDHDDDG